MKYEEEERFSEQRGQLSSVLFFAGPPDTSQYIVITALVFPELGSEQPHHLGNTARSLRSNIPGRGTGRVEVKAMDELNPFLSLRILWGPGAELFKRVNLD